MLLLLEPCKMETPVQHKTRLWVWNPSLSVSRLPQCEIGRLKQNRNVPTSPAVLVVWQGPLTDPSSSSVIGRYKQPMFVVTATDWSWMAPAMLPGSTGAWLPAAIQNSSPPGTFWICSKARKPLAYQISQKGKENGQSHVKELEIMLDSWVGEEL